MIQLQNVTKRIKENTVLDNVSYTFKSGFVYGLYGQNGSGKTMLLRAISEVFSLMGKNCMIKLSFHLRPVLL